LGIGRRAAWEEVSAMARSALAPQQLAPRLPGGESLAELIALLPLPVVVTTADGDGRIIQANKAALDIMGLAGADLGALHARDFYHDPADRRRFIAQLERDREVNSFEARLRTAQGAELWVLISARLFRYRGDAVALVSFQDISDRKRAQAAVAALVEEVARNNAELEARVEARTSELRREIAERRAVEERLREARDETARARRQLMDAIESIADGFVLWDAEGRLVLCNSRYRESFGFTPDLLVPGARYEDIIREGARRGLVPRNYDPEEWVRERLERHRALGAPYIVQRADGRWTKITEHRTQEGGIVGIRTDVTELKQHAQALDDNRRLLRAVIDAVPAVINVKDRESRYILMNRFQGEVYGVEPEQAIGRTSVDFVGPVYGGRSIEYDRQVIASGEALPFAERAFVDVNGKPHTWFTAKTPLKDAAGRVSNVVTVALDITALKETERARANLSRYFPPSLVELLASADKPFGPARSQKIAILFVDIVGSTRLAADYPPQRLFALLRAFHAMMANQVFAHGGTLDKYTGDGLMATFGTPEPGEHDATSALRCATAMRRAIVEFNDERRAVGEAPVLIAIGIHYGEVLLGNIGTRRRLEFAVIGESVNIAARLERLARPLEVGTVISAPFVERVRTENRGDPPELAHFVARGPQAIRGIEAPLAVWTAVHDGPE
jgi:PAS domain S-box-containing protein